jgi:hypothetical protein
MGERVFDTSGQFIIKNAVFDVIMPELSPNAFKVLCVAIRQTWGWVAEPGGNPNNRREWDRISYSQFKEKAGIGSDHTVKRAIDECLEAGYLLRQQVDTVKGTGKPIYAYALNTDYELASSTETVPEESSTAETAVEEPSTAETAVGSTAETAVGSTAETAVTNTKEYKQSKEDGGTTKDKAISYTLLTSFGVSQSIAKALAAHCPPDYVTRWIEYVKQKDGLHNPAGFLVSKLKAGEAVPETRGDERRPDSQGKYAKYIQT